jgi:DNA-binding NarL/FixJ family response regulator
VAVSVVTVDDQVVFRETARDVIEATPGFEAVGDADSGEAAIAVVDELEPQLVLVDVRMPGMNGVETARRIRAGHPDTVVVLISIEEPANLPAAATSEDCPLVRKQDFGPALLRELWAKHGTPSRPA